MLIREALKRGGSTKRKRWRSIHTRIATQAQADGVVYTDKGRQD